MGVALALIVRLRAAEAHTNVRKLEASSIFTSPSLKRVANLAIMELLVEFASKVDRQLHKVSEIFRTTWSRRRRSRLVLTTALLLVVAPFASFGALRGCGGRECEHCRSTSDRLLLLRIPTRRS